MDLVSNVLETTWPIRYPYPTQVVLDRGTEFMAEFTEMISSDHGVKKKTLQQEILKQTVSLKGYMK
eukprot:1475926-Ditylum_brightwellii.AAC.1